MNALIIYDSVFGNTEKIARSIGAGLASRGSVEILPASQVTPDKLRGLDLIIVGSPTRGFRPTEATVKFLKLLPKSHLTGVQVAAFDTRIWLDTINSKVIRFMVNAGGYAAAMIAKMLQARGGNVIAQPEGFLVTGEQGPLKEGELERAANWARGIAA